MIQLQAGYVLDCVKDELTKHYQKETVDGLLRQLSFFDVEIDTMKSEFDNSSAEQILFIAHNLISRGLPTRPSLSIENKILQSNHWIKKTKKQKTGSIKKNLNITEHQSSCLFRALHIIDPSLKRDHIDKKKIVTWEKSETPFEEDFLYNQLPMCLPEYWIQLFESQRELEKLLQFSAVIEEDVEKYISGVIQISNEQKLDFSIEFPYLVNGLKGLVIEIDGPLHEQSDQISIDNNRDTAVEKAQFGRTIRMKTSKWENICEVIQPIEHLEKSTYFSILKQNMANPLYQNDEGLSALEMTLMPFAIARIQKTIIHLLLNGVLNISAKEWNIAVLEKDIPCAKIAFEDLQQLLKTLSSLQGDELTLPKINLSTETGSRFEKSKFASTKKIDKKKVYDLFLDISLFQRSALTRLDSRFNAETKVLIRSSYSPNTSVSFKTTVGISYKALGRKNKRTTLFEKDKTQVGLLEKFMQDIFRKTTLKTGQIELISQFLQGKSVIGLLPAGYGKSLAYQLSALLQPGITMAITPVKSLMKDQYEELRKNGIDCVVCINSSLNHKERRGALKKIKNAQALFVFVTPEKLQDDAFRRELSETSGLMQHYFSSCVIDEAHCVSEWGHEFRMSYLRLGETVRRFCKTKNSKPIPLIALTATASYDVLSDIQNELGIEDGTAIIRRECLDGPEIQYKVVEVQANLNMQADVSKTSKQLVGEAKQRQLIHELLELAPGNPNYENSAGLVFCPQPNGNLGISDTVTNLKKQLPDLTIGAFYGDNRMDRQDKTTDESQSLFMANQSEILVATHTFGIGINKSNIHYVIHLNYPESIEHYYQEVGRAGRDGKPTIALLLFNKQQISTNEEIEIIREDGEITKKVEAKTVSVDKAVLQNYHRSKFKGVEKELNLITELLSEIKYPSRKITNYIEERILDEFSIDIKLMTVINGDGRQILLINDDSGSIYLDRDNLPFHIVHTTLAVKLADFIKQIMLSEKPEGISYIDWLNQYIHHNFSELGIERLLEKDETPDEFQVFIPFTNDKIEEVTRYLNEYHLVFTDKIVSEAQNDCNDGIEFLDHLERRFHAIKKENVVIPDHLKPHLIKLFSETRNEQDTFKAVFRLSVIGVIDDYTVDYNSKTITATISRKEQGYYTNALKQYIAQYKTPKNAEEKMKRLPLCKGNSEMQRCMHALLRFIYEEVALQHEEAIDAMEEACFVGLQEGGSEKMKTFIHLYRNAKYACPQYLPADTQRGTIADFSLVEKYMGLIQSGHREKNNLTHLIHATTLLLNQHPDNFVFILLRSFATFLIEKNNADLVKKAQMDLINGFLKEQQTTKENAISLKQKIAIFKEKINLFDADCVEKVEETENSILLNTHISWLKEFNDNFITI